MGVMELMVRCLLLLYQQMILQEETQEAQSLMVMEN